MSGPTLAAGDAWLSVLPPLLAIVLAIVTRQVFLSLFLGIWLGWTFLEGFDPLSGLAQAIEACVNVFADAGNTRVILFSALVGALIAFTRYSGGVAGFVEKMSALGATRTRRQAMGLSYGIGVLIFIESSITSLVNGAVCRPIFDKMKISREKLAYLCDATAAPICILIPLNAWGAYIIALLHDEGVSQPVGVLIESMATNFYAILSLVFALLLVITGRDFGPMKEAERRVREEGKLLRDGAEPMVQEDLAGMEAPAGVIPKARRLLVPVLVMVVMMPLGLLITGKGDLLAGSGSTAVLWAVLAAVVVAAVMTKRATRMPLSGLTDLFFKGVGALMPLALLMVLAFAIGQTTRALGTGAFVAQFTDAHVASVLIPALCFALSCLIAFSTGTSWGTFAIMLPIAVGLAGPDLSLGLLVSAVLGGGVFGDHCSPISDTTMIASMAAGTDHIDHVNTQLPYALTVAGVSVILYVLVAAL